MSVRDRALPAPGTRTEGSHIVAKKSTAAAQAASDEQSVAIHQEARALKPAKPAKAERVYADPQAIVAWRKESGLTLAKLASAIGLNGGPGPISASMRGRRLSAGRFAEWCERLATTVAGDHSIQSTGMVAFVALEDAKPADDVAFPSRMPRLAVKPGVGPGHARKARARITS